MPAYQAVGSLNQAIRILESNLRRTSRTAVSRGKEVWKSTQGTDPSFCPTDPDASQKVRAISKYVRKLFSLAVDSSENVGRDWKDLTEVTQRWLREVNKWVESTGPGNYKERWSDLRKRTTSDPTAAKEAEEEVKL